ncbi:MAG: hypothetical protein RIT05_1083 [Bacteroidota bacterium]|jgi:hypothetical protein
MAQLELRTFRIKHLCKFLSQGGGSRDAMMEYINDRLLEQGMEPIKMREVQYCLEALRKGDFLHSRRNDPPAIRSGLFKVSVIEKKYYKWAADTQVPEFGDLEKNERFTLPFLAGILKRYEAIPAVQKILNQLPEIFNITETEMQSRSAIFHTGPEFYDDKDPDFQEKIIDCVIKIMSFIHERQAIVFNYTSTKEFENIDASLELREVAPLQIRYHENYFYLISYDLINEKLATPVRIDQIHRFKVQPLLDDNGVPAKYNLEELERQLDLQKRYKDALGIFPISKEDELHEIIIEFREFAATYVKRLKIHHSQKIIEENKTNKSITISLKLHLRPENAERKTIFERQYELAFFLGRFREYAKVTSWKKC